VGVTLVTHDQKRELAGMVGGLGLHRELEVGGLVASTAGGRSNDKRRAPAQRPAEARRRNRRRRAPAGA
jgi:hypothetical protein